MKHRHLNHEGFSSAAIEDILARGRMPDWVPLIVAIQADPHGETAEKTRALCERDLYAAPVFRRVLAAARVTSSTRSAVPPRLATPLARAD